MRRAVALLTTMTFLLACGCGSQSYEKRLKDTIGAIKYRKQLDDNLLPPPTKSNLEQLLIFVRPPKGLQGPAKEFLLPLPEPGKFDLSDSFAEQNKQSLHILARVKRPKNPANKKGAPTPADTTARGDFATDVFALLGSVYNVEIDPSKAKADKKRNNDFKHVTFEGNGKNVQVYLYGTKAGPYETALVFEFPKSEQASLAPKINLCLGSFAVGERARRAYTGGVTEEEIGEGAGGAPAGVF